MSVLKRVEPKELAARKQAAEHEYRNRVAGFDAYAYTDPVTLRPIGAILAGGIEAVQCAGVSALIPTYIARAAAGYSMNEDLGVIPNGPVAFNIYMNRPEADIKRDLVDVLKKAEAAYEAEIKLFNDAILEKEINAQLQLEIRREEKERLEAEQARLERITNEVKAALGAKN